MSECIFCKIINGEIPSKKVYEDENVFAFSDIHPQAKYHILFVPKKHISGVTELNDKDTLNNIYSAIKKTAKELGIDNSGYRICTNNGSDAGQTVSHLHFHVLGGERLSDRMA